MYYCHMAIKQLDDGIKRTAQVNLEIAKAVQHSKPTSVTKLENSRGRGGGGVTCQDLDADVWLEFPDQPHS